MSMYTVDLMVVALLAWRFHVDRWAALNAFADDLEKRRLPAWFRWSRWGDPISWVHHLLWSAAASLVGAAVAMAMGLPAQVGGLHFGALASVFYFVRELNDAYVQVANQGWGGWLWRGAPHYTGWLVDGTMDWLATVLAPLLWGTVL